MGLSARLTRLERRAAVVLRCAWCRCHLVSVLPPQEAAESCIWKTCRFCGNRYRQSVGNHSAREVETLLLWYHTYDGETFRDERAYAAKKWWEFRWEKQALERASAGPPRAAANLAYRGNYGRGRQERWKETRAVREQRELREEAEALLRKAATREARKYGPRTFPLVEVLRGMKKYDHDFTYDVGYERRGDEEKATLHLLHLARCMEACEVVLWGETEPETLTEIGKLEAKAETLAEERRRAKREKEEAERLEREHREEERRQRLKASALAAQQTQPVDPSAVLERVNRIVEGSAPAPIVVPPPELAFIDEKDPSRWTTDEWQRFEEYNRERIARHQSPSEQGVGSLPGHRRYYRPPNYRD
jgi:hypothetical protein